MLSLVQVLGKGTLKQWEQLKGRRRAVRCGERSRRSRAGIAVLSVLEQC